MAAGAGSRLREGWLPGTAGDPGPPAAHRPEERPGGASTEATGLSRPGPQGVSSVSGGPGTGSPGHLGGLVGSKVGLWPAGPVFPRCGQVAADGGYSEQNWNEWRKRPEAGPAFVPCPGPGPAGEAGPGEGAGHPTALSTVSIPQSSLGALGSLPQVTVRSRGRGGPLGLLTQEHEDPHESVTNAILAQVISWTPSGSRATAGSLCLSSNAPLEGAEPATGGLWA